MPINKHNIVIYREHFGEYMKVKKEMSLHKKTPISRGFLGFTESSVTLFPLFQ